MPTIGRSMVSQIHSAHVQSGMSAPHLPRIPRRPGSSDEFPQFADLDVCTSSDPSGPLPDASQAETVPSTRIAVFACEPFGLVRAGSGRGSDVLIRAGSDRSEHPRPAGQGPVKEPSGASCDGSGRFHRASIARAPFSSRRIRLSGPTETARRRSPAHSGATSQAYPRDRHALSRLRSRRHTEDAAALSGTRVMDSPIRRPIARSLRLAASYDRPPNDKSDGCASGPRSSLRPSFTRAGGSRCPSARFALTRPAGQGRPVGRRAAPRSSHGRARRAQRDGCR